MPLRILKRNSKQYNVVSKSAFVISVELLDNGVMECTLDSDSTGRECLLNISQRLGLHQYRNRNVSGRDDNPEFFGLRYISRGVPPRHRWVDLDRPLRKQLQKYAQDSQLSLGVMFYVGDVNLLKDEMARYHYFLQCKSDVIDGKLNCSIDQAISLAAYSLQGEFGDFDPERHTVEYLRDFAILPKDLISTGKLPQINVDALFEAVVRQYHSMISFPPPLAEIYYIMVAQQLDGYGQEPYPAKDDAGNDILICISANGLIIRRRDWTHIAAFRWIDIKSLLGHKRLFVVESSQSHRTMQYHFSDTEVAKYVRKICLLQSTFYKENIQSETVGPQQQIATDNQHIMPNQQDHHPNRNINLNNHHHPGGAHMGNMDQGAYFPGVPPDLLAPTMSSSTIGASSNFSSSMNNSSSSFNQSGLSLNSSSASALNVNHQLHFNQNHGMFPSQPQSHLFQSCAPHLLQQQGVAEPLMFHHPGELYNQIQMIPSVRTNPLADLGGDLEYSNGYGRAVSDYTAALQQKYGSVGIPDLSSRKSSSQLYFSSSSGGERSRSQSQTLQQIRASLEEEPIYQNEIVSQMHSMELRDSASNSNSASDVNGNGQASSSDSAGGTIALDNEISANTEVSATSSPSSSMIFKDKITDAYPNESSWLNNPSTMNFMQSQPLTTTQPPQLQNETTTPSIYVFKPPPPYPGLCSTSSVSNSAGSIQNKSSSGSNQEISTDSSVSNSTTSLSRNTFSQPATTDLTIAQLSPSATSSIVSAQIHSEPGRQEEEEELPSKEDNDELSEVGGEEILEVEKVKPTVMDDSIASVTSSTATSYTECSTSANSSSISTCVDEVDSPKPSSSTSCFPEIRIQSRIIDDRCPAQKSTNKAGQLFGKAIDPAVLREFQAIPKTKNNPSFATALKRENSKRNRTPDILPYEDNSVKIGDRQWLYTVAQLPLPGNGSAFWQLIWEKEIKVIVALERDSSALFYPLQKGATLSFNDFQVVESKGERRNSSNLTIAREFNLIYTSKKKQRKVFILPYEEEWKDDVPVHTEHFLCFLEEVNSIQRKVSEPTLPLTVLCGTGAGRSGIFILSDLLLHAADCGHKLRCDALLKVLRQQRMSLVSNASQYAFVLHTLAKYLAQSRLI
ncbi:Tyrosine-protein phosphatase non-receptor type 14 [Folsomia candida]|uniref:protein-tyrosine-phosphatase n=1 Tax=Folsomia candida TaxID=158441 RepID=A0A226EPL5_FOLCA|nr:Tyrosine-protein phosphatase non-receptor type 14 [Folsomia candida]